MDFILYQSKVNLKLEKGTSLFKQTGPSDIHYEFLFHKLTPCKK